jgi:hypothetical protein
VVMRSHTHRGRARRGRGFAARASLTAGGLLAAASALVLAAGAGGAAGSTARAGRTISLNDSAQLHKLGTSHGFYFNETGQATGTIGGTLYLHLHIASSNRVTAEVNIYPRGSSISGSASASYFNVNGAEAGFSGKMSITRGTGSYAHASGSGLNFSGTIQRKNDAVTVHVSGRMSV